VGLDAEQFADVLSGKLGWTVPVAALLAWENGKSPPPTTVRRIVRHLADARRPAGILAISRNRLRLSPGEFSRALAPIIGRPVDEGLAARWEPTTCLPQMKWLQPLSCQPRTRCRPSFAIPTMSS